jgi:hypothetical protein
MGSIYGIQIGHPIRTNHMLKSIIFLGVFIVSSYAHAGVVGDINGDGQVGLNEAIYSLQSLAGIRPPLAIAQAKVVSKYVELAAPTYEQILMTVPPGKVIVITDIVVMEGAYFWLYENDSLKMYLKADVSREYHFKSGILFSSTTNIIVKGDPQSVSPPKRIFISGYEVNQ